MTIDDEVLAQLYRVMDERSARPPASPGPRAVHERIQRRRRARITVRLVAAALVVVLAGAATWVSHERSWRTAEPAGPLVDQPVRGSLAGDAAFLAAARRKAVDEKTLTIDGRTWRPPAASAVKVLYAGDADGYRWVLVTGPWRERRRTGLWRWLIGPAGQPASTLYQGAVATTTPTIAVQEIQAGRLWTARHDYVRTGAALAVGVGDLDARLAGPARYAADGRVALPLGSEAERLENGVYAAILPRDGSHRLAVDGTFGTGWRLLDSPPSDRREYAEPGLTGEVTQAQAGAVLGDWSPRASIAEQPRPSLAAVRQVMSDALLWSGLPLRDARFRLIDAESIYDPVIPEGVLVGWSMAMAVMAPSGASFVGVQTVTAEGETGFTGGVKLVGWAIRPAGGLDGLALAAFETSHRFYPRDPGESITYDIRLLPPVGARAVDLLGPEGRVKMHTRTFEALRWSGVGLDRLVTRARFLDAHRHTLAVVPIQGVSTGPLPVPGAEVEARMPMMSWPAGEA